MNSKLKTLLTVVITVVVVGGGVYFWQQPSPAPKEDQTDNVDYRLLFEGSGFSFRYPSDWTLTTKEDQTHFYEEDSKKMAVYRFDVMGPRCTLTDSRDFTDSKGRSWKYSVLRTGAPENLQEMCAKYKDDQSMKRTAEILMLKDNEGNYLASLSYNYNYSSTDQEREELEKFETILDSVDLN